MIANYGCKDGSGEYYISIDTDKCVPCTAGRACPDGLPEADVRDHHRRLR